MILPQEFGGRLYPNSSTREFCILVVVGLPCCRLVRLLVEGLAGGLEYWSYRRMVFIWKPGLVFSRLKPRWKDMARECSSRQPYP